MKVLITGGAGFIGSHVAEACLAAGHQILIADNLSRGKRENVPAGAVFHLADITGSDLYRLMGEERPKVVVHLAAQVEVGVSVEHPVADAQLNAVGTLNLLEACRQTGVTKVVYASSAAVYGNPAYLPVDEAHPVSPLSPYGISKYVPEMYLRLYRKLYGIEYTVLRFANVYGPRQDVTGEAGVVAIFLHRLLQAEQPRIYGDGEQTRDFVYVEDVARANLLALEQGHGAVLNVSTGLQVSVNDLYRLMDGIIGSRMDPRYLPPRPGDVGQSCLDNTQAGKVLGWAPEYKIEQGLKKTVTWGQREQDCLTSGR